jgi:hypothetical protein
MSALYIFLLSALSLLSSLIRATCIPIESPLSISNEFPSPRPGYLFDSFLAVPVLHLRLRDHSLVRVRVLCTITFTFT